MDESLILPDVVFGRMKSYPRSSRAYLYTDHSSYFPLPGSRNVYPHRIDHSYDRQPSRSANRYNTSPGDHGYPLQSSQTLPFIPR